MNIFIGSSKEAHESGLLLEIARIVEDSGHTPIRWNQSPSIFLPGKFTLEVLEELAKKEEIGASIFLYTADDKVWYRGKNVGAPRDNVVFEHGLFSGRLGRSNSIIIKSGTVELPSDLSGLTFIDFSEGNRAKAEINLQNWLKNVSHTNLLKSSEKPSDHTIIFKNEKYLAIRTFNNLEEAKPSIIMKAQNAQVIKILANKGIEFFGSDSSIISLADCKNYKNLKRLKMILLSPSSSWINRGFMALRKYESIDDYKSELNSTHIIVEMGMKTFLKELHLEKSGIKYQQGEPYFRFIMLDDTVFVTSYGEKPSEQVRDLPVYEIKEGYGSLYGALKKLFNGLWFNNSVFGKTYKENIDIEISAGGFVFCKNNAGVWLALVQREDGSWVLPKGHKKIKDSSLEETAIREVSEETGLEPIKLKCLKKIDSYSYDETAQTLSINKINHFYLIEYSSNITNALHTDFEHLSAKWWNIEEELPFMFYVYQKILINETIKKEFGIEAKMHER